MKVTFIPIDDDGKSGQPFHIAAGGKESPKNFRISATRDVQVLKFLRGLNAKSVNRGNRQVNVVFEVTRLFDNEEEAERFVLEHENTLPGGGEVHFISELNTNVLKLRDAVLTQNESSYMGATSFHSYQISGGIITK